ncbi:acyltransferase [Methylobacterium sp. J-048]|uniref:acyltransferase family protein n=1 Tax=Methylobacterium sp. J-048 TaxID=2836635 RepID=UPI001FBA4238|nr:acyltransferase [Methylobacterium sp. J-048]MCJ2060442.1 acyltransferase [Methylobacterium sp. J-048]
MRAIEHRDGQRLAFLDGWRGVAILLVLVGHFLSDTIRPGLSVLGVDLFFVLSGRLMAEILFVRRVPLKTFFVRRFSRVYPALLVFVVAATALFYGTSLGHGVGAVATALTFTTNYAMIYSHPIAVLDHLWSLCVEEHGYLLLAVIATAVVRDQRSATIVLLALGFAAMANGIVRAMMLNIWFPETAWRTDVQIAPLFLAGGFYLAARRLEVLQRSWISPTCLVLGLAVKLCSDQVFVQFGLGTVLLALAVATIDFATVGFRSLFEPKILCQIGLWSFSLYLWQQPFYKMAHTDLLPAGLALLAALCVGVTSFYLVEVPMRLTINERWQAFLHKRSQLKDVNAAGINPI